MNIPENVEKEIKSYDKPYGCEKCGNSGFTSVVKDGYTFSKSCECYKEYQFNLLKTSANIPAIYFDAGFDLDESVIFSRCKPLNYAMVKETIGGQTMSKRRLQFKQPIPLDINGFGNQYVLTSDKYLKAFPRSKSIGLILSGEVGSGKTYFACGIANEMLKRGFKAYYLKAKQYIDNIVIDSYTKDEKKSSELKRKRDFLNGFNKNFQDNCHLLVLDELGFEHQKSDSGHALAQIKDLLRNRAEKSLPTIITTNFMPDELVKIYEEELVSMFAESYMFFLVICPDDYRLKKSADLDEDFDFDSISVDYTGRKG